MIFSSQSVDGALTVFYRNSRGNSLLHNSTQQGRFRCVLKIHNRDGSAVYWAECNIPSTPCICFIAYKVYKELQRIIALHGGIGLSVDKVIDIAKTIPTIKIRMPYNEEERTQTLFLTDKHRQIEPLFDINEILKKSGKGDNILK